MNRRSEAAVYDGTKKTIEEVVSNLFIIYNGQPNGF